MKTNTKTQSHIKMVQYISTAFLALFIVLISVCVYSYIQAGQLEHEYDTRVLGAYRKVELANDLYNNNTKAQNFLRAYLSTSDKVRRDSLRAGLSETHKVNDSISQVLGELLATPKRKILLDTITSERHRYYSQLEVLLNLIDQNKLREAGLFAQEHLVPYYSREQAQLTEMTEGITESSRKIHEEVFAALSEIVNKNAALLLLAIAASIGAALVLLKVFRHLQEENLLLNSEILERRELQKSLLDNQKQYEALFNNNPLPLLVFDQDSLEILEVNDEAIKEYGYTRNEFKKITLVDLKPQEERERLQEKLSNIRHVAVATDKDIRHVRKDGSAFEVEIKTHTLPHRPDVNPRLVVVTNVQERTDALEKLKQSERQLREVSTSMPGAVYQFQVNEEGKMSFPFISDGIIKLYNLSPEDLYEDASKIFTLLHPDDIESVNQSIAAAVKSVTPWYSEFRLWNSRENRWKWVRGHSLPTVRKDGSVVFNGTLIDITSLKETQHELLKNEANLQALLNSSPQAIFLLDEHMHVVTFNQVAEEEVKRYSLRKLSSGHNIMEYLSEKALPEVREDHALAMQGKEVAYETGCGANWFEICYRPAVSKDNKVVAVALTIHDITEQRNLIEKLKRNETQLERAQQLAKIGSWEYDIKKDKLLASNSLADVYGLNTSKDDINYEAILKLHHPDDLQITKHMFEQAIANKAELAFDHRIITNDGSTKYLHTVGEAVCNADGVPVKVSGATQDITELKLKEQEATIAKEKFQTTLENIPEAIFSSDAQFNIHYVSPQVQELTGYREEDFIGDAALWGKVVHPDDAAYLTDYVIPTLLSGKGVQYELRLITKTGETKWVMFRQSPAFDSDGNVIRVDSSAADVTARKMAEARRTVLTEQLQQQNEHLQQFAHIVSHNLRTPIANILGLTSIFKKDDNAQGFNAQVIENLAKSAQLLDTTIRDMNDILTIRGQITNTFEAIRFEETLEDVLISISQEVSSRHAIIEHDFEQAPEVHAIRSYVNSILQNLIVNSLKYSSPERQPHISVNTYNQNDYICLQVSDNGRGIDLSKQKDKIFGLYKRFHPQIEGRGVGLHLVKTQAELLGGKVEVESQVDAGTTFRIYFKKIV